MKLQLEICRISKYIKVLNAIKDGDGITSEDMKKAAGRYYGSMLSDFRQHKIGVWLTDDTIQKAHIANIDAYLTKLHEERTIGYWHVLLNACTCIAGVAGFFYLLMQIARYFD